MGIHESSAQPDDRLCTNGTMQGAEIDGDRPGANDDFTIITDPD
jgi:hypothetical protein